jgi:hypothetical protein
VGAAAGGAAKAAARQPYRQRAERGWAATVERRSDTRGFRHRRSERHSSTLYGVGARVAALPWLTVPDGGRAPMHEPRH